MSSDRQEYSCWDSDLSHQSDETVESASILAPVVWIESYGNPAGAIITNARF